ncbi:MAG: hypothetical protein SWE60_19990 [Thermodesulfobacteriota bacterium]|nr:hypothetical protein [Thermodesulfobacteriota bacterium]
MTGSMVKSAFRDRTEQTVLEVTWVEEVIRSAARSMAVISLFFFLLVGHTEAGLEPSFVEYKDDLLTVRVSQADVLSLLEEICKLVSAQVFVFDKITHHNGGVHLVDKPAEEVLKVLLRGHSYAILFSSDPSPATGVYVLGGAGRGPKGMKPITRRALQVTRKEGEKGLRTGPQRPAHYHEQSVQLSPVVQDGREILRPDSHKARTEATIDSEASSGEDSLQSYEGPGLETALRENGGEEKVETPLAVEDAETYLLGQIEELEWQIAARQSDNDYNPLVETLGLAPIQHDKALLEWYKNKFRKLEQK